MTVFYSNVHNVWDEHRSHLHNIHVIDLGIHDTYNNSYLNIDRYLFADWYKLNRKLAGELIKIIYQYNGRTPDYLEVLRKLESLEANLKKREKRSYDLVALRSYVSRAINTLRRKINLLQTPVLPVK
jgi:hypothetical protein